MLAFIMHKNCKFLFPWYLNANDGRVQRPFSPCPTLETLERSQGLLGLSYKERWRAKDQLFVLGFAQHEVAVCAWMLRAQLSHAFLQTSPRTGQTLLCGGSRSIAGF
jgi:hypothetical protein